jgi:hypothetical protein
MAHMSPSRRKEKEKSSRSLEFRDCRLQIHGSCSGPLGIGGALRDRSASFFVDSRCAESASLRSVGFVQSGAGLGRPFPCRVIRYGGLLTIIRIQVLDEMVLETFHFYSVYSLYSMVHWNLETAIFDVYFQDYFGFRYKIVADQGQESMVIIHFVVSDTQAPSSYFPQPLKK